MDTRDVIVCGAGLAGSLLAISLQRKGFNVTMYEARSDMRKDVLGVHRSINLVITSRGRYAVRQLGLEEDVMSITVPVVGRAMHGRDGTVTVQPYGKDDSERNYSVSRADLNKLLMTKAEQAGVTIHFSQRLVSADIPNRKYVFADPSGKQTVARAHVFFGSDGAGSASRAQLISHLVKMNPEHIEFSTDAGAFLQHRVKRLGVSYKELLFPKGDAGQKTFTMEAWGRKQDGYTLDPRYLHIWPRGGHFLMGLPNREGSITGTVYVPDEAAREEVQHLSFDRQRSREAGMSYLQREYPDAVPLLGDAGKQWVENPHAWLASTHASHWVFEDKLCLVGDAAHAVTPFFGQGMNCAFEDVTDLMWVLSSVGVRPGSGDGWSTALRWYQQLRKRPADDLAEMAEENYVEMAEKVGDPAFLFRKQVEVAVERAMSKSFRSRYWMITNTLIPYDWIREAGRIIDEKVVDSLVATARAAGDLVEIDVAKAEALVAEHLSPFFARRSIDLTDPWKFYSNRPLRQRGKL
eukprot:TRINITY_DN36772_c0_g1_i1.p1 TRINITY_DN36772_c0_g1~~TRINITY_DN36772_c0_g1_i1.p1  ORF type:complete len:521 (+),score=187.92 TRINITY_DN36772_c0_g1_i1:79-1641(+)